MSLEQKYPRTPHLSWSQPDKTDLPRQVDFDPDPEVVVMEKLDGENTTIYSGGRMHARSMDSRDHQSRHWLNFVRPNHVQTNKHWMHTRMVVNVRR